MQIEPAGGLSDRGRLRAGGVGIIDDEGARTARQDNGGSAGSENRSRILLDPSLMLVVSALAICPA
jgi:hypothetical protein